MMKKIMTVFLVWMVSFFTVMLQADDSKNRDRLFEMVASCEQTVLTEGHFKILIGAVFSPNSVIQIYRAFSTKEELLGNIVIPKPTLEGHHTILYSNVVPPNPPVENRFSLRISLTEPVVGSSQGRGEENYKVSYKSGIAGKLLYNAELVDLSGDYLCAFETGR